MKNHLLPILRQGIWASLTGGWCYDKNQNHFSNAFHLYFWLLLFLFPISIEYLFKNEVNSIFYRYFLWFIYWLVIAILFTFLKTFIEYLHNLFEKDQIPVSENSSDYISNHSFDETSHESESGIELKQFRQKVVNDEREKLIPKNKNFVNVTKVIADVHNYNDNYSPDTNSFNTVSDLDQISKNTNSSVIKTNGYKDDYELDNNLDSNSECKTLDGMIININDTSKFYKSNSDSITGNETLIPILTAKWIEEPDDVDAKSLPSTSLLHKNSTIYGNDEITVTIDRPSFDLNKKTSKSEELLNKSKKKLSPDEEKVTLSDTKLLRILSSKKKKKTPDTNNQKNLETNIKVVEKPKIIYTVDDQKPTTSRAVCSEDPNSIEQNKDKKHLAKNFSDTSDGAIHFYIDKFGKKNPYIFGAQKYAAKFSPNDISSSDTELASFGSLDSLNSRLNFKLVEEINSKILENLNQYLNQHTEVKELISQNQTLDQNTRPSDRQLFDKLKDFKDKRLRQVGLTDIIHEHDVSVNANTSGSINQSENVKPIKRVCEIKFPFLPGNKCFKLKMDRLILLGLIDRCKTYYEIAFQIFLAVCVAIISSIFIEEKIFTESSFFVYCFVVASCQYTLIKSVQPDASSPIHGFNRIIAYSRPIYFILISSIILISKYCRENSLLMNIELYGIKIFGSHLLLTYEKILELTILFFPLIFSFGLFPQIDTFCLHLLEQIDIHLFGGTASISLIIALYSTARNILMISFLYIIVLFSTEKSYHLQNQKITLVYNLNIFFSLFCSFMFIFAYLSSRSSTNSYNLLELYKKLQKKKKLEEMKLKSENAKKLINPIIKKKKNKNKDYDRIVFKEEKDFTPIQIDSIFYSRIKKEMFFSLFIFMIIFYLHWNKIFELQNYQKKIMLYCTVFLGFFLNYLLPELRTELPWGIFGRPFFETYERQVFEVKTKAKVMWFEYLHIYLWFLEKNIIYPFVFLNTITNDAPIFISQFGFKLGLLLLTLFGFKVIRSTYNNSTSNYIIYFITYLLFNFDLNNYTEPFLLNYFLVSILISKIHETFLKLQFVYLYMTPWQLTWGSAFHAFAQPFSFPHSGLLFLQAIITSFISAPLQPVFGSTIFLASYARPVKFWEKKTSTKLVDSTRKKICYFLANKPDETVNNTLNALFYEQLTNSLQLCLCGDLMLGRWGKVEQGDFFLMESEYLNCFVHIIELGNGFVTFQLRGLEIKGTFCQDRENQAINDALKPINELFPTYSSLLNFFLPFKVIFDLKWLAWDIKQVKYVIKGYSITDTEAFAWVCTFDNRKHLISSYVKSVIYYTIKSKRLRKWITNIEIRKNLDSITNNSSYTDTDANFTSLIDDDYDSNRRGISRESFLRVYGDWINYCVGQSSYINLIDEIETISTFCFLMSILARRLFSSATLQNPQNELSFLLKKIYNLFLEKFILQTKDSWVNNESNILNDIIGPSIKLCMRLHQNYFIDADINSIPEVLYRNIQEDLKNLIVTHESDPRWRKAVLKRASKLLSLRFFTEDNIEKYKIITLTRRNVSFKIVKMNREAVRGLWAGQQQELIYFRNDDPERGSIQNAKQVLRNTINSSCDLPIGYPIYVSSYKTSFFETSKPLKKIYPSVFIYSFLIKYFLDLPLSLYKKIKALKIFSSRESRSDDIELNTPEQESSEVRDNNNTDSEITTEV